jgi:hypothetical protein
MTSKKYGNKYEKEFSQKVYAPIETNDERITKIYNILTQPSHTQQSLEKVSKEILAIIDSGSLVCQLIIDIFIDAVGSIGNSYHGGYYHYDNSEGVKLTEAIYNAITKMFTQLEIIVTDSIIDTLCKSNMIDCIDAIFKSGKNLTSSHQTKQILTKINKHTHKVGEITNKWVCLIENYPDSFVYTTEILLLACSKNLKNFISECVNRKVPMSQECFYAIINIGDINLVKLALLSGAKYDNTALEYACKNQNLELIKLILSNKVKPTNECFEATIQSYSNGIRYAVPKKTNIKADIIDMLVASGYKVTYENVVMATKLSVELHNFKSLGIELSSKFMEVCASVGFYPYENCGIKPNLKCLRLECNKSGNLTIIRKLVASGLKPDAKCLSNACKHKSNMQVIRFLIEKGSMKPNLQCLLNSATCNYNKTLLFILEEYMLGLVSKVEVDKMKLIAERYTIDDKDDSDCENVIVKHDDLDDLSYSDESVKPKKPTKKVTTKKAPIILSDDEIELEDKIKLEKPVPKSIKKKTPVKKSIKKTHIVMSDDDIELEEIDEPIITKPKSKTKVEKVQKHDLVDENCNVQNTTYNIEDIIVPTDYNFRENKKISTDVITSFNLGEITEISFINLRKTIMKYITANNLVQNQTLMLDNVIQKLVKNKYTSIDLKNMDKLIFEIIN